MMIEISNAFAVKGQFLYLPVLVKPWLMRAKCGNHLVTVNRTEMYVPPVHCTVLTRAIFLS